MSNGAVIAGEYFECQPSEAASEPIPNERMMLDTFAMKIQNEYGIRACGFSGVNGGGVLRLKSGCMHEILSARAFGELHFFEDAEIHTYGNIKLEIPEVMIAELRCIVCNQYRRHGCVSAF